MKNGELRVMITGMTMMQELCVANWGSQGVSIDHYSTCQAIPKRLTYGDSEARGNLTNAKHFWLAETSQNCINIA